MPPHLGGSLSAVTLNRQNTQKPDIHSKAVSVLDGNYDVSYSKTNQPIGEPHEFLNDPNDLNHEIECQISDENYLDHTVLEGHLQELDDYQVNANLAQDYSSNTDYGFFKPNGNSKIGELEIDVDMDERQRP
jgi:hypothetical protein